MVKIRLQRKGKKHMPFYRIVVADSRTARGGKSLDTLGHYNPLVKPAEVVINNEKLEKWIKVGAQMTTTVKRLVKNQAK